jgi:hypothetical protein
MDPRRARDPRLARADPRLQRVQQDTPAPTPTPPPPHSGAENGYYAAPTPPPNTLTPYPTDPQPVQPVPGVASPTYKQRPLFCVVCASNQVNPPNMSALRALPVILESLHGGTPGVVVRYPHPIPQNSTDLPFIEGKPAFASFPLVPDPQFVYPGLQ